MSTTHSGQSFIRYTIDLFSNLSWLCPCLPLARISRGPPSPPDSPQQDELQLLLSSAGDTRERGWSEDGDDLPIRSFNHRSQRSLTASSEHDRVTTSRRTSSVFPSSSKMDPDARSLRPSTINGLVMQFEPSLTLADIAREEREQAEREQSRRSIGLAEEDEFGDYTGAVGGDTEEAAVESFGSESFKDEDNEAKGTAEV